MLECGSQLRPNFWRAPTDNDFGAKLNIKYGVWRNPTIALEDLSAAKSGDMVVVTAKYTIKEIETPLTMSYTINNVGAIQLQQSMVANAGQEVSDMFRFGVRMEMPESYNTVEYYGRGGVENYADRNHSTPVGLYRQSVEEQFFPYIRPQESGTRSDLRWWRVVTIGGCGLEFRGDAPLSASALNYTQESLDDGLSKGQRHSPEVATTPYTNLCIDQIQMGLGCINSWNAMPREEYLVPYQDYDFNLLITPVRHKIEM